MEGKINEVFRRKNRESDPENEEPLYIVCGVEGVGWHVIGELHTTQKPFVIVDSDPSTIEEVLKAFPNQVFVEGDAIDKAAPASMLFGDSRFGFRSFVKSRLVST